MRNGLTATCESLHERQLASVGKIDSRAMQIAVQFGSDIPALPDPA